MLALLLTQIIAFPAAIVFGKIAARVRNDILILICIVAYMGVGIVGVFLSAEWQFWVLACIVGLFQGGVQALSRSYFAQLIPAEQSGLLFGILDIFGKGASFVGTILYSTVAQLTVNVVIPFRVNFGAIPIVCLFVAGFVVFVFAARENRKFLFAKKAAPPADGGNAEGTQNSDIAPPEEGSEG